MKQRIGYSGAQIALHWTIAVLILFNYIYSDGMGRALHARLDGTPATDLGINPSVHVWVGVAVLVLSTEPETILTLADRVTVLRRGVVAKEFTSGRLEKADLLDAA